MKHCKSCEGNTENTMSHLYFNEGSDYSEGNTCGSKVFRSTTLQPFQFEPEQIMHVVIKAMRKKHIHASAADLLHIRIGNLDWCKGGHCKNEAKEIDYLCCREVDAMLITSAKIPQCEGTISHPAFMGICPTISRTC